MVEGVGAGPLVNVTYRLTHQPPDASSVAQATTTTNRRHQR